MVTISWFSSYVIPGSWMNEFIINYITNKDYVDYLSPQLYSGNCPVCNTVLAPDNPEPAVWDGVYGWTKSTRLTLEAQTAYKTASNTIIPSINFNPTPENIKYLNNSWKRVFQKELPGYIQFFPTYSYDPDSSTANYTPGCCTINASECLKGCYDTNDNTCITKMNNCNNTFK